MKRISAIIAIFLGVSIPSFAAFDYAGDAIYSIELLEEVDGVQYGEVTLTVDRYWNAHEPVFTPITEIVVDPVIEETHTQIQIYSPYGSLGGCCNSPPILERRVTYWFPSFGLFLPDLLWTGSDVLFSVSYGTPHLATYENGVFESLKAIAPYEELHIRGGYAKEVDALGIHSLTSDDGYIPHLNGLSVTRHPSRNGRYRTNQAGWYHVSLVGTAESLWILSDIGFFWNSTRNGPWLYFWNENRWVYLANQSSSTFWVWDSLDRVWRNLVAE